MFLKRHCFRSLARVLVALGFVVPLGAQQPSVPQAGVYHCGNGFILTISRCGKIQGVDACFFKIENKGQVLMDSPGSLTGVSKIVRKCKGEEVEGQAGTSSSATSGATNPPYLSEMPAPARILAEIKGRDAEDTGERQMGAFRALVQIIDDMAWGLGHRNVSDADSRAATPDERRLRFAYETAYRDLWHKVTNEEGHVYDHDPALRNELLRKFFSENFRAQYFQSNQNEVAEYKAFQDKMYANPAAGTNQASGAQQHYATDAGSVAVRKCVESGRSDIECLTEGFKVGMGDLAGKDSLLATAVEDNKDPGLRLTGLYSAAGAGMTFRQELVKFTCGGLLPEDRPYSVELNGTHVKVIVAAAPKPLVFSFQGGKLIGPGAIDVAGRVQTGPPVVTHGIAYKTHTEREWIDPTDIANYPSGNVHNDGAGFYVDRKTMATDTTQTTRYEIPNEPKTVRCNLGVVPATGDTPKITDIATTFLGSNASKSQNTAPGLRLNGTYAAQGGLSIEFRADSATLECGQAGNSEAYRVVPEGGHLVVKFDNKSGPLSLVLQPNGSLAGQGTIDLAGRIIQGTGNDPNHFVPLNARCTVGTLTPQAAR